MTTQLQRFLSYIVKDTVLKEVKYIVCESYFYNYHKATYSKVKKTTVQNKQST